ncbi:MAG: hypothetical protein ACREBA_06840 [Nitrosotalea sp.]
MSYDNDAHQLKIKKLQERLSGISGEFRKGLTAEIQSKKQNDTDNVHSSTVSSPAQTQQKQTYDKAEKELSVEEILQQLKQTIAHKQVEPSIMETQKQISHNKEPDRGLNIQESAQSLPEQNIVHDKSWQPWKLIPRERLSNLEKKTLNKFFKKN